MTSFKALVVDKTEGVFSVGMKELSLDQLPAGEVLIKVMYSSVNYKDGLASIEDGKIVKSYPFVPGIDLAGIVVSSESPLFSEGDHVLVTSYELGVSHYGGYSEYARVPGEWVVPLPEGLTLREAMIYGTAGFTAALAIHRLEENHLAPDYGPVLVTGATGGVGSMAVAMLTKKGFHIMASTGKDSEHNYLSRLGAQEIICRQELTPEKVRPMDKARWAGAVDSVGGKSLAYILSSITPGGSVAVAGLTGGTSVPTTVFPFILRGVNLLGIDSAYCPMNLRTVIWKRLATDLYLGNQLEEIAQEIILEELPDKLAEILNSQVRGRIVVKCSNPS